MAKKTKVELKEQSTLLLKDEGLNDVDLIDSFALQTDVDNLTTRVDDLEAVSTIKIGQGTDFIEVRRMGHMVTLDGSHVFNESVGMGAELPFKLPEHYAPVRPTLLSVLWASGAKHSDIKLDNRGVFTNTTGEVIPQYVEMYISGSWYSEAE